MNFDIHTTHRLLMILEDAKQYNEDLIDDIPLYLLIVNESKEIVRANSLFCAMNSATEEELLSNKVSSYLDPISLSNLSKTIEGKESCDFMASIVLSGKTHTTNWKMSSFKTPSGEHLYWMIGVPLYGDQEARERFEQLMKNIPYGILRVDRTGLCTREFSSQLVSIMGRAPLLDESLKDYFESRVLSNTKTIEAGVQSARAKIRPYGKKEAVWCEWSLKEESNSENYGDYYFSIFPLDDYGNKNFELLGEPTVDLKQYEATFGESYELVHSLREDSDSTKILAILHSLKSCARMLGEIEWVSVVHKAEEEILDQFDKAVVVSQIKESWEQVKAKIEKNNPSIKKTEQRLKKFSREMDSIKKEGFKSYSLKVWTEIEGDQAIPLSDLREHCLALFDNYKSYAKLPINFNFTYLDVFIPEEYESPIKRILQQLISNSIAHGFHSTLQRKFYGKKTEGNIDLAISENNEGLVISFKDDGEGIQFEKLRSKIEKLQGEGSIVNNRMVIDYLKKGGVSESASADDVSGHGIGFQSIFHWVGVIGGEVEIDSNWEGTTIHVFIPLHENKNLTPSWLGASKIQDSILSELSRYLHQEDWTDPDRKICIKESVMKPSNMLIDTSLVVFVVGGWCSALGENKVESIQFELSSSGFKIEIDGSLNDLSFTPFNRYVLSRMLHLNKGSFYEKEGGVIFDFSDGMR